MKYKTYINGVQIFGDDACYGEWMEFLKSQGIEVDEDNCYDGYITDFMGAMEVMESIVERLYKEREDLRERTPDTEKKNLFDFTGIPSKLEGQKHRADLKPQYRLSLFDQLSEVMQNAYAFQPYAFYMACRDQLEPDYNFTVPGHLKCFKLKYGNRIHVKALRQKRKRYITDPGGMER